MTAPAPLSAEPGPDTRPDRRTALLAAVGRLWQAARPRPGAPRRTLARWHRARTPVLSVAGFALLSAAAWMLAVPAGLAAAGTSLLILELLSHDEGEHR